MSSSRFLSAKLVGCGKSDLAMTALLRRLGARVPDHFCPARRLPPDIFGELLGRARDDFELDVGQALAHLWALQDLHQLLVVALDDRPRRAARREKADPGDGLEVRKTRFDHGGRVRRGREAFPAAYREHPQLARAQV